jgi:hypothetical protein
MDSTKNNATLSFRAYTDDHDTDISVDMQGDNVNDERLRKLLLAWLTAIGSNLTIN